MNLDNYGLDFVIWIFCPPLPIRVPKRTFLALKENNVMDLLINRLLVFVY